MVVVMMMMMMMMMVWTYGMSSKVPRNIQARIRLQITLHTLDKYRYILDEDGGGGGDDDDDDDDDLHVQHVQQGAQDHAGQDWAADHS